MGKLSHRTRKYQRRRRRRELYIIELELQQAVLYKIRSPARARSQRGHENRKRVKKWIVEATVRSKARDEDLHTNPVLT